MKRAKTRDPHIFEYEDGTKYYRRDGIERSLGKVSQFEAEARKRGIEAKIDTFGRQSLKVKVRDVFHEYMDSRRLELQAKTIRQSTLKETDRIFTSHLLNYFGRFKFIDINEALWDKYVESKFKIDLANHRKVFGHFMRWAKRKQYTRYSLDMKIPIKPRRKRKVLTSDSIQKILMNSDGSLLLFVSFYLFMGMRRSEIMTLDWSRVDLVNGVIELRPDDTKTKAGRTLPLNEFVWRLLVRRYELKKGRWVFPNAKDHKRHADLSGLKTAWRTCLKRSGLLANKIQWHDLRATHQYYSHTRTDFTDTQREKFSGSNIEVQKKTYVSFGAKDLKGLENVVHFDGLNNVLEKKLKIVNGEAMGKVNLK